MDNDKLLTQRKYNVLIQDSRYDLSLQEQRIVLGLIQVIESTNTEFKGILFFCAIVDQGLE